MTTRLVRFAAFAAHVGGFRAVDKYVLPQTFPGLESFATSFAPNRRIRGVSQQMSIVQIFAVELSFASITREVDLDNPLSRRVPRHEMSASHVTT